MPKIDNLVGIDLGIKTKVSCRDVSLRDMKCIFVMQRPYMVKKIDAPKPLKKPIKKSPKLSKSLSKKLRVLKDMKKLDSKLEDIKERFSTQIIY